MGRKRAVGPSFPTELRHRDARRPNKLCLSVYRHCVIRSIGQSAGFAPEATQDRFASHQVFIIQPCRQDLSAAMILSLPLIVESLLRYFKQVIVDLPPCRPWMSRTKENRASPNPNQSSPGLARTSRLRVPEYFGRHSRI